MPTIEGSYATPTGRFALVAAQFSMARSSMPSSKARFDGLRRARPSPTEAIDLVARARLFRDPVYRSTPGRLDESTPPVILPRLPSSAATETGRTTTTSPARRPAAATSRRAALATGVPVIFGILTTGDAGSKRKKNRAGRQGGQQGLRRRPSRRSRWLNLLRPTALIRESPGMDLEQALAHAIEDQPDDDNLLARSSPTGSSMVAKPRAPAEVVSPATVACRQDLDATQRRRCGNADCANSSRRAVRPWMPRRVLASCRQGRRVCRWS